jgi:hypothetical protein
VKALVVNCSGGYNLGTAKLADWLTAQGHQVDRAIGSITQIDPTEPGVVGKDHVAAVRGNESRTVTAEMIKVDAIAMDIGHHQRIAVAARPIVTQVDQGAAVRVAAAGLARGIVFDRLVASPPSMVTDVTGVMVVVGDRFQIVEGVGIVYDGSEHHLPEEGENQHKTERANKQTRHGDLVYLVYKHGVKIFL